MSQTQNARLTHAANRNAAMVWMELISHIAAQHLQEDRIRVQHGMAAAADPNAAAAHQQAQQQQVGTVFLLRRILFYAVCVGRYKLLQHCYSTMASSPCEENALHLYFFYYKTRKLSSRWFYFEQMCD